MSKISFPISVFLVSCLIYTQSFAEGDSSALKAYSKGECRNFEVGNYFENKNVYQTSWLKITKDTKTKILHTDFKCANGENRKLKLDIAIDTDGGEAINKIICERNFLLISFTGKSGEGHWVSYLDLRNCADLGSGNEEHYSPDKKFFVLITNGSESGYEEAQLSVTDCRGSSCKKLWSGDFGQDGFYGLKWKDANSFTVERDDRHISGEGPKWLCTFDVIKSPKLSCKKR